jgi:hypothetical protein
MTLLLTTKDTENRLKSKTVVNIKKNQSQEYNYRPTS